VEEILGRVLSSVEYKLDGICASIIRILTKFTKDTAASGVFTDNIAQENCERLFLSIVPDGSGRHVRELLWQREWENFRLRRGCEPLRYFEDYSTMLPSYTDSITCEPPKADGLMLA